MERKLVYMRHVLVYTIDTLKRCNMAKRERKVLLSVVMMCQCRKTYWTHIRRTHLSLFWLYKCSANLYPPELR